MLKITPARDLAATLLRVRRLRRLSLDELAASSGVSPGTLSGIESGLANPRLETLASIATIEVGPGDYLRIEDDASTRYRAKSILARALLLQERRG